LIARRVQRGRLMFLAAIWVGLAAAPAAAAEPLDWSELERAARSVETVAAAFTQEKSIPLLTRPLVSRGRLYYRAPDNIRWEYTEPIQSVTLLTGDRVRTYLYADGRWVEDAGGSLEIRRMVLDRITDWFAGKFDRSEGFSTKYDPGPPPEVILTAQTGLNEYIERIRLVFGHRPGVIHKVEIVEGPETRTELTFDPVTVNRSLPDDAFAAP
jgi:outer membrane lipoprotein carrier protein